MMNEADQYLLEIMEGENIKNDIAEMIKGIHDPEKIKLIYTYIKAMKNK